MHHQTVFQFVSFWRLCGPLLVELWRLRFVRASRKMPVPMILCQLLWDGSDADGSVWLAIANCNWAIATGRHTLFVFKKKSRKCGGSVSFTTRPYWNWQAFGDCVYSFVSSLWVQDVIDFSGKCRFQCFV